jgi:quercetin dioxygenase-like cupin family protein
MVVLAGVANFTVLGQTTEVSSGQVLLAPAAAEHSLVNRGDSIVRILFAYPAVNVERIWGTDEGSSGTSST